MRIDISPGETIRRGAAFFLVVGWWPSFVVCLFAVVVQAQYRFDHWTADNGLPQNSVRDIVQTRDGYLWLTTFDGLVRFDGVRFTVFNKSNTPGIVTNRFMFLYEDGQGDLWANTETGDALTRLHNGRFTTYTKENGLPGGLSTGMGGDGQGHLLLFSQEHLWRWVEERFQSADGLRPSTVASKEAERDLAQHPAGGGDDHIFQFFGAGGRDSLQREPQSNFRGVPMRDRQGRIWHGSRIGLWRGEQGRFVPGGVQAGKLAGRPTVLVCGRQPLQFLTLAADDSLWLTEVETGQSRLLAQHPPEGVRPKELPLAGITVALADREGNFWLGSLYDGLYRARPQSLTTIAKPQGLSVTEVYPLLEDRDGALWIGAQSVFRLRDGVITRYDGHGTFGMNVSALAEDRAGHLWVNGRWRSEKGGFVRGLRQDFDWDSLEEVWTMYEDRSAALWLGAVRGVLCVQNGVETRFTTADGLAGNDTKVIIEDVRDPTGGSLWLGSYGGLTHYRDGRFQRWTEKDGLPGATVRALKQDADGTLWIGTYDSGLGRFKDGRFTRYTVRDGLFDSGVFQILEDDYGWLWMSCNRGIYRVRKQELNDFADGKSKTITCISYGKGDGMENVECNGGRWPAGVKTRDGKLWFPTMGGVVSVDPATIRTNSQPPPVVIETMRINNETVAVEAMNAALGAPHSALELRPGQENFEIDYTALSFINAENLRFKYKLEGWDRDWVEVGTRRTAYYSHVAPDSYTFKVIAANSDGIWNDVGQSLRIRVLPPFYRTWWFLTLGALSGSGLVFAAFKYRVNQLEQRQAAQQEFARQLIESQEAERKRIAAELHDGLGQNLLVIKNRALFGLMQPDDAPRAAEQLGDISTTVSQAIDEVRQIAANLHPYQLDRLGLTKALTAMIRKVGAAAQLDVALSLDNIDDALDAAGQINLYRIAQECLNNIVKHAAATEASVQLRRLPHRLQLHINDNGRGFVNAERGVRSAEGEANPKSKIQNPKAGGFGLTGLAERALLLHGTLHITTAPGEGTRITLTIPLPERYDLSL